MRFTSNKQENISLDEYVESMKKSQQNIYFILAPTIEAAKKSVYYEPFEEADLPVLFLTEQADEIVMSNLG